jgi:uncharacterized protein (DUF305 family)
VVLMNRPSPVRFFCVLVLGALALSAAACGSDDDDNSGGGGSAQDRQVEKAFLTGMVHHHETAIEMARIAEKRGRDRFVKRLAANIVGTQEREIAQMRSIYGRLVGGKLTPDPRAHDGLGLSAEEAGMTHTAQTSGELRRADPFDRAFVDEMVPHHRGAIAMARVVLDKTRDPALKNLANTIIRTQQREVDEMNEFRTREFGGPVPESAGHGEGAETSTGMEHESGH